MSNVEQNVSTWFQVRTLTRGGKDKQGAKIDFPDEKSAVEFASSVSGERDCRVVKVTMQETLVEYQRYATPKEKK